MSAFLRVDRVVKRFGARDVLRELSLDIQEGQFVTLLGESGSGKTTLLRLIAGFEKSNGGSISIRGQRIDDLPPYKRPVNTVFQHYALFPHLSVLENVAYGLRAEGTPKSEILPRAEEALRMVKMSDFAAQAPARLSGGQQQRVALARALVKRPQLLLLDEPLSALDANLRRQMQSELKALQREVGITFLFVTHDQAEAMALSDQVALLREGKLEQLAAPRDLYERPATEYAARFVGRCNVLRADSSGGLARCGALNWACAPALRGQVNFALRPERVRLASGGSSAVRFSAQIHERIFEGACDMLELKLSDGQLLQAQVAGAAALPIGKALDFEFNPDDVAPLQG